MQGASGYLMRTVSTYMVSEEVVAWQPLFDCHIAALLTPTLEFRAAELEIREAESMRRGFQVAVGKPWAGTLCPVVVSRVSCISKYGSICFDWR